MRKTTHPQRRFMLEAIKEAEKSRRNGDYAIGSVIVKDNKIVARGQTMVCRTQDPTSHNEMVALRRAARKFRSRHLRGCTLYSTCAPCAMCTTACVWACLDGIVYGATQQDMAEYSRRHGTYSGKKKAMFQWRGLNIEPEQLYRRYLRIAHPQMKIAGCFMRKECRNLFHT